MKLSYNLNLILYFIFCLFLTSCTLQGKFNNLDPETIPTLSIETKADGTGEKIIEAQVAVGGTKNLYLIKRDKKGNLREAVDISWELSKPEVGTVVLSSSKRQAVFTGKQVGITYLKIINNAFKTEIKINVIDSLLPTVEFSSATSSQLENVTAASIAVTLSPVSTQTVTVNYGVTGGSASAGTDYTVISGTLTFSPGETSKNISFSLIDDVVYEGNETIIVDLSSPTNSNLSFNDQHTFTILEDEAIPTPSSLTLITPSSSPSSNTTPVIRVGGVLNGLTVRLYTNSTCTSSIAAAGSATGSTIDLSPVLIVDNVYNFYAQSFDSLNNSSACSTATLAYTLDSIAPTAIINGAPTGSSSATTLNITISGADVTHYVHKIGPSASMNCADGGYIGTQPISVHITTDISAYADGPITLCVLGRDSAGNFQAYVSATSTSWTKFSGPHLIYRSVGYGNTTALATGAGNGLTISSGVATFTVALPHRIGVGDALQYDSDNNGTIDSIVFISGRIDSTHYTVKTNLGATPADLAIADNDWSLFRAYTSYANSQSGTENTGIHATVRAFDAHTAGKNLVSSNEQWNIALYADGAVDSASTSVNGWTTSPTQYLKIFTPVTTSEVGVSQRHQGSWGSGAQMSYSLHVRTNYVHLDGISNRQNTDWEAIWILQNNSDPGSIRISNSLIVSIHNSTSCKAIGASGLVNKNIYLWNNLLIGAPADGVTGSTGLQTDGDATTHWYVYNNTTVGRTRGTLRNSGNAYFKNNIMSGGYTDWGGGGSVLSCLNNASSSGNVCTGTGNKINQTFSFMNPASYNYYLTPNDTAAKNAGLNLSADPDLSFSNDIIGHTRTTWDIGAAEAADQIFRSVGFGKTTSLATAGASSNMSITSGVANFQYPQSYNIGIGDAIEYDSDGNGTIDSIAFIYSRNGTTNNSYNIRSADGTTPTDKAYGLNWSIYRAYTSLPNAESGIENTGINAAVRNFDTWAEGINLKATNQEWNIALYADAAETSSDINFLGWTTSTTNFLRIFAPYLTTEVGYSQRHDGYWSDTRARVINGNYFANLIFSGNSSNSLAHYRVEGLQLENNSAIAANNRGAIDDVNSALVNGEVHITNNLMRRTNVVGHGSALNLSIADNSKIIISNNVMQNFETGAYYYNASAENVIVSVLNNTIHSTANMARAINIGGYGSGTCYFFNNIIQALSFSNSSMNCGGSLTLSSDSTNNLTSDASALGTVTYLNKTVLFNSPVNSDFRLSATDIEAKDKGTSLATHMHYPFSSDNTSAARFGTWDLGAYELPTAIYRSVGPSNASALATGTTNDLTITAGVASFSVALANNIGVGDVIQYDNNADGVVDTLAFINGRIDSNNYNVQTSGGAIPANLSSADNDWSIFRAYTSLSNASASTENTGIIAALRNFDSWTTGKNLIASNQQWNIALYGDAADTTYVSINGWTTDNTRYLRLYTPNTSAEVGTSQRHSGVWNAGAYTLNISTNHNGLVTTDARYTVIEGLQLEFTGAVVNSKYLVNLTSNSAGSHFRNNILRSSASSASGTLRGVGFSESASESFGNIKVYNNIIYDFNTVSSIGISLNWVYTVNHAVYNNTIYNCEYGIYFGSSGMWRGTYFKNNLVVGNTYDLHASGGMPNSGPMGCKNNATTDTSGTNFCNYNYDSGLIGIAPASVFINPGTRDLRLLPGSPVQFGGLNLSTDPDGLSSFNFDITGQTRSSWSIGADDD